MPPNTTAYSPDQLELYLQRIKYADATASPTGVQIPRLQSLQQSIQKDPLTTLTTLQRKHLAAIPWGNSALHYSQHRSVSTHPAAVFDKLVVRRHDGYCMENTNLFYGVLCSLGYQVYPTGGRVCTVVTGGGEFVPGEEQYLSLNHMVLIVTIDGQKYMVDVGFGNNSPTSPLPLRPHAAEEAVTCIAPSEMRLVHETLPEFVDRTQKVWIYQVRYGPGSAWVPHYSFSEVEFLPQDFAMMNFWTSKGPVSWFTQALFCTRLVVDETTLEPRGVCILSGKEVKRRVLGQTEVLVTFARDGDRVEALARWFGIVLLPQEVDGIQGMVTEIK
ncbi:putative N-acetyltransferase family protein [Aspergillus campestris IBT 28561]|uniref:N-acetyltransferase family protein n=1 Tax=Aspergillus campestris (strain IBT 28561) TaxID=1392248 RepID=A0A2I1CYD7_ASPC2|nr:putative N-acetyltransferase family protein [Aspergillus campestris IBT 28561]PKY02624.1 putative N-acetyltransferase family protein [Aspergillus campestris IBT 28561]